jgi:hypothetical protein
MTTVYEVIARATWAWQIAVIVALSCLVTTSGGTDKSFYRWGPHRDLAILGFVVDTPLKYAGVITYSFVNAVVRTTHRHVLSPWLVNNVQDAQRDKTGISRPFAYEVSAVLTLYQWIDWLLYMNLLLTQIDMMLFEVCAELLTAVATTHCYLRSSIIDREEVESLLHEDRGQSKDRTTLFIESIPQPRQPAR